MRRPPLIALFACFWMSPVLRGQERTVAITVDDLPFVRAGFESSNETQVRSVAVAANDKLLGAFHDHGVPVTGFVIQQSVESLGPTLGAAILKKWVDAGLDLGNHSYSHPDFNGLTWTQAEREIAGGETAAGPLMSAAGKQLRYFRFPMNHTGGTQIQHDRFAGLLAQRGYELAVCTIDNSDYLFDRAYARMLTQGEARAASRLRAEYLRFTAAIIDYYASLNRQVFGYEPPQVMLLHANLLNADTIRDVLAIFEQKRFRFVRLETAQADPAYRTPTSVLMTAGPMWGYRWAADKKVKVDGRLEPEPPEWILSYPAKMGSGN